MLIDLLQQRPWTLSTLAMFAFVLVAVAIAITIHEYAHARSAMSYGDDTAAAMGRMTLNPKAHYDPIGSTLFLLFGFGWAKPVPVRPDRMRNPQFDGMRSALWGPLSNILVALVGGLILRLAPGMGPLVKLFLMITIQLNLFLAFFNLLPLPPLDGSRIWTYFLPRETAYRFERFAQQYGFLVLMILVFLPGSPLMRLVSGLTRAFFNVVVGPGV